MLIAGYEKVLKKGVKSKDRQDLIPSCAFESSEEHALFSHD
jgi:hypothetical protein